MTPKLTNEQREAAQRRLGQPVLVEDEQTQEIYFLVKEADAPNVIDNWTRLELQKGFDAIDRGDVTEFDAEKIKAGRHGKVSSTNGTAADFGTSRRSIDVCG